MEQFRDKKIRTYLYSQPLSTPPFLHKQSALFHPTLKEKKNTLRAGPFTDCDLIEWSPWIW